MMSKAFFELVIGQSRGATAFRIIRQAVISVLVPPIQPETDPVTILLVDVGNLIQRIASRTEQHRMRSHPIAMCRISLLNFLEALLLRFPERVDEFGRRSHSFILPKNICSTTYNSQYKEHFDG